MSSIQKVNNIGRVKFAKFQANESTTSPRVYLNDDGVDTFKPSFKANKVSLAGKVKQLGTAVLLGLTTAAGTVPQQSCCKPAEINNTVNISEETNITIDMSEVNAYLARLVALMEENNAQNAAYQAQIIQYLAQNGVDIQTIINYLANANQHLSDLVDSNEEIKAVLVRIESVVNQFPELMEASNELLSQILAVALNINANQNVTIENQERIIALLNQLLDQVGQMNEQQAQNFNAILEALNNMSQQLQAQLLDILDAIQNLDENMQAGYQALLAQLNGMSSQMQAGLLQLLNHIDQMSNAVQQKLNQIISLFGNLSQQMQAGFAQILAQLQNMQEEQQMQVLQIMEQMTNMQEAQQQQYLNLMLQLQNMDANAQAQLLAILSRLTNMQEAQQQQYLNLMLQLQNMQGDQQAQFLELMAQLTNLQNGQQQILNAMQGLNAQFLSVFAQALEKLDTIIENQGTITNNQATQIAQLADILAAIQHGNAQLVDIKALIEGLDLGIDVNLDVIEELLAQILASQNTANNLLVNMNDNIEFILATNNELNGYVQQLIAQGEDFGINFDYWANKIFNRIPEAIQGCNCEECCAQIIEILQQIDQHIQDMDWNHEGIDDDLDPLLG